MSTYALRRLWQLIPVILIVSIAVFSIIHLIPGDPAQIIAGPNATDEQLAALRQRYGLDEPLWTQYFIWLRNVLSGDLGNSYTNNYSVAALIAQRVPATIELALAALLIGVMIAFPLGIWAAVRPGSLSDLLTTAFSALAFATPSYYLFILLILLVSARWQILPPSGRPDPLEEPWQHIQSLILPAVTLGIGVAAGLVRYLRSSLLEVMNQDYLRAAKARGVHERMVLARHALTNAFIPVVTMLGLQLGELLSGAIIIESIYAWPGVGRLTIQAVERRDYLLLQADVLFIVLAFLVVNLLTDLAYGWIDPRIRHGAQA